MRKRPGLILIIAVCLGMMSVGTIAAQDKVVLKLGEFVTGSITEKVLEQSYSFSAKKGDIITVEALPDPEKADLNPAVELRDSDGKVLAANDDFSYPLALAIAELPADGDYIAVVGRSGGEKDGDTYGDYSLRVSVAELVSSGSKIEAKISSDYNAPPTIYVMRPEKSGSLDITFSQKIDANYASLDVIKWIPNDYPDTLVSLDSTAKLSKATLSVDLEADQFYVLQLKQASYSFGDPVDFPVTLELK
ncbi:MAG: hypothetical protein GC179_30065 [Anaerolineaceae bacterium]|nr:hypothetical protein [Anaerolineaceae bacterium]